MLEESRFHVLADEILERIAEKLEDEADEWCEAELQGGVLSVIMADEQRYQINKHATMRQIWVSSPYSGAAHFMYDPVQKEWISTRQHEITLLGMLSSEMSARAGHPVSF